MFCVSIAATAVNVSFRGSDKNRGIKGVDCISLYLIKL